MMNNEPLPPMNNQGRTALTEHPPSSRFPFIAFGALAVLAIGGLVYWVFFAAPASLSPKTIGIIYFRQQIEFVEGFKQGMEKLGYRDIVYKMEEVTVGPTMLDDIKKVTQKLVNEKVDLLFATLEFHARAALEVTAEKKSDIPVIFMTRFHDPVEYGLIASYKSSGNNVTGVATNMIEIVQKTLGFLKEINPAMKKIGVFGSGFMVPEIGERYFAELKNQASRFGLEVVEYTTTVPPPEVARAWKETATKIKPGDIDALFHIAGHIYEPQEQDEYELVKRLKIPQAVPSEDLLGGGHFAYSDDNIVSGGQAAVMADKIFRGTKPSDIPIEFGSRSILTLNLTRARETGIKFSDSMLFIAGAKIGE